MSPRPSLPANRPVLIAVCLMTLAVVMAVLFAATAKASFYQMVLCAANNGSNGFQTATNTTSPQNPGGIFSIENYCGPAPFPAGGNALLRIVENQSGGNAGVNAYASVSWAVPPWVSIVAAGGYTRQPGEFRDGWRARFWAEDFGGGGHNILMQGSGVSGGGIFWGTTSTFASHLWPFSGWGGYRRFVYEMTCVRPAGCDRAGWNGTDANTFVLTLDDSSPSQVWLTDGSPLMSGQWVKGTQTATYAWSEQGSGIRFERLYVDGGERWGIDHIAAAQCNRDAWGGVGEFARDFHACPNASGIGRSYVFETASLADGPHALAVCTQDYAQWQGIAGTGGQSCASRTIHTDNSAPGAPSGLQVTSANPERYLPDFGASFSLPPNQGSPIARVHYRVIDATGDVVQPVQVISATNPTELKSIGGPQVPGEYRLQVWLEDQVGWVGPASTAPIPRDTTPPAAPQGLQVAAPETPRSQEGFDLRWRNIADAGSPIDAAHYRIENGAGDVVVSAKEVGGTNPEAIESIEAPGERGNFTLRLWLSDAEGNVGAPVSVPLAYGCLRSTVGGGRQLSAELDGAPIKIVEQGQGATMRGELRGTGGDVAGAGLCIFSQVAGEAERQFLGIAITGSRGDYRFAIGAGPSRILSAVYRPGQRRLSAEATLQTRVKPTLRARSQVVRTGEFARLEGEIPGPRNDDVVIVLQVRQGDGWLAFRRYKTRGGGRFQADYLFRRTARPTTYEMRAQVRETIGYPYVEGDSDPLYLRVLPARNCAKGKRLAERKGKSRCVRKKAAIAKRCAQARRASLRRPKAKRLRRRARVLCAAKRRGPVGKQRRRR